MIDWRRRAQWEDVTMRTAAASMLIMVLAALFERPDVVKIAALIEIVALFVSLFA